MYPEGTFPNSPPNNIISYSLITSVGGLFGNVPSGYILNQNYPNPFNPATVIKFSIPDESFVNLTVYDVSGKKVEELVNREMPSGNFSAEWKASSYASGVYFYKLNAGSFSETKKMILSK